MSFTNPFTGQTLSPSQVGYEALTISTNTVLSWPVNGDLTLTTANIMQVTATVASLQIAMPPAAQVSQGQAVIFNNTGSYAFTVTDTSGNTLTSVSPGTVQYLYVTDNTTNNGLWTAITLGAGTSSASAAALAGYGLLAIGSTLNQAYNLVTQYSNITLDNTYRAKFIVWGGGVGTLTLPASATAGNNWFAIIRNNGTGILTLSPQGTDTIDGNSSQQLQLTESLVICCNGSGFNTFAYGRSNTFPTTILSQTVTGGTVTLTSAQAANVVQEYSGTLTSNSIIVLPSTVQIYYLSNGTSGAFTMTFQTTVGGGATLALPQGKTVIAICDGTNVFNAQTSTTAGAAPLTLSNGSSSNPSLNFVGDTTTGLYLSAGGTLGFAVAGSSAGTLSASGLKLPVGISAGTF